MKQLVKPGMALPYAGDNDDDSYANAMGKCTYGISGHDHIAHGTIVDKSVLVRGAMQRKFQLD